MFENLHPPKFHDVAAWAAFLLVLTVSFGSGFYIENSGFGEDDDIRNIHTLFCWWFGAVVFILGRCVGWF